MQLPESVLDAAASVVAHGAHVATLAVPARGSFATDSLIHSIYLTFWENYSIIFVENRQFDLNEHANDLFSHLMESFQNTLSFETYRTENYYLQKAGPRSAMMNKEQL